MNGFDIFTGQATGADYDDIQRRRDRAIFGDELPGSDRRAMAPRHEARLAEQAAMEAAAFDRRQAAYLKSIAGPPAVFDEPDLSPATSDENIPRSKPTRAETRQELVERANALLASLTPRQRKEAIERARAALAADPRDERGRFRKSPILRDDELTALEPLVRP